MMTATAVPAIDERKHLTLQQLQVGFGRVASSPKDVGTVCMLVARPQTNTRLVYQQTTLTEAGMPGDRWQVTTHGTEDMLAVMNEPVTRWIANGQSSLLYGDNLSLDLDLSIQNLPIGSKVMVGEALTQVTRKPHKGCSKYAKRFGQDALRFIASKDRRDLRLRGIYLRVLQPGSVAVGDRVEVVSRG